MTPTGRVKRENGKSGPVSEMEVEVEGDYVWLAHTEAAAALAARVRREKQEAEAG